MSLSINFDSTGIQSLQALWSNHLHGLGMFRERLNLPDQIVNAMREMNAWIASNTTLSDNLKFDS